MRTHAPVACMYIIRSKCRLDASKCKLTLKIKHFYNFLREIFGGFGNSLYFCTRFWEIHFSLANKERVLWKILHKQTSSTRSGLATPYYIYGSNKLGKRNEPSRNWHRVYIASINEKDIRPKTDNKHRFLLMQDEVKMIFYNGEFDPGSGWTLATGLTHASRGETIRLAC